MIPHTGRAVPEAATETFHPGHVLQFYETEEFLYDRVTRFVVEGFRAGEPLALFARPELREEVGRRLAAEGIDLADACRSGRVLFFDAAEALEEFMEGELPDEKRFRAYAGAILERASGDCTGNGAHLSRRRVRAYGEMVDLLWREGKREGAVRLEDLWNELERTHGFRLLCAYAMENFHHEADAEAFRRICEAHAHVMPTEAYLRNLDGDARLREVAMLQQRARALEREIEERKHAEEALRRAKDEAEAAHRAKSDFLAVMSHELRTPLNAIMGYQDLLRLGVPGPLTPDQENCLERIDASARHLLGLINQILTLTRPERGEGSLATETVDVDALLVELGEWIRPAAATKGLELRVTGPAGGRRCETDPGKLGQILLNLLSNAVKFTNRGHVELLVHAGSGALVFEVRDTGDGIDPADVDRIFEPFVQLDASPTRANGGTGLGLSVSRDLAALLGGELTVASAPGEGTTFTLRIPDRPAA